MIKYNISISICVYIKQTIKIDKYNIYLIKIYIHK